jgi:hypothetical protein
LERYDPDGLELDFMRFPYYFPYRVDSMHVYAGIMTEFVGRVHRLADSLIQTRNKKILLTARVPSSLNGCEHVGLDPTTWCKAGLIDFLTVAPFLSTETDIPVAEFKAVCGSVPIYTGMEFTIGTRQMTREEKRAAAALLYSKGSDGMYLFNYFVAWDAGLEADTDVLRELACPDSLVGKDKLYTIAVPRYPIPGVSLPGQLPLRIESGMERSIHIQTHEPTMPRSVIVRLECAEDLSPDDLHLGFNSDTQSTGKIPLQPQIFPERVLGPLPLTGKTLEFSIDPAELKSQNVLTVKARRPVTLEWVYLAVRF